MQFTSEELSLIRDALASFRVGVEHYDEMREELVAKIDEQLAE